MDNASDYGSEDSRFDSWQARNVFITWHEVGAEILYFSHASKHLHSLDLPQNDREFL